jgi:hypothetical protein
VVVDAGFGDFSGSRDIFERAAIVAAFEEDTDRNIDYAVEVVGFALLG